MHENRELECCVAANARAGYAAYVAFVCILVIRSVERLYFHKQIVPGNVFLLPVVIYIAVLVAGVFPRPLRFRVPGTGALSLAIVLLPLLSICVHVLQRSDAYDIYGRSSLDYSIFIYVFGLVWFFLGAIFSISIGPRLPARLPTIVFACLVILLIYGSSEGGRVNYSQLREANEIAVLSHLWITESAIVLFFLAYVQIKPAWLRLIFFVAIMSALFLVGGRSSFIFAAVALIVYEVLASEATAKSMLLRFLVVLGVFGGLVIVASTQVDEHVISRLLLTQGVQADGSWIERRNAVAVGAPLLWDQLLFGGPHLYVSALGNLGWYIHDIRSAWQFFGFPFFLGACALYAFAIRSLWVGRERIKRDEAYGFSALFLIFVALAMLNTVFIGSPWFWFAMGLWFAKAQIPVLFSSSERRW